MEILGEDFFLDLFVVFFGGWLDEIFGATLLDSCFC